MLRSVWRTRVLIASEPAEIQTEYCVTHCRCSESTGIPVQKLSTNPYLNARPSKNSIMDLALTPKFLSVSVSNFDTKKIWVSVSDIRDSRKTGVGVDVGVEFPTPTMSFSVVVCHGQVYSISQSQGKTTYH